jgi:hypothetical protein
MRRQLQYDNMSIAKFDIDFKSVRKVAKKLKRKKLSTKKWQKNGFFTFITACNFFQANFMHFFKVSNLASNFAFMIPIPNICKKKFILLIWALFDNFKTRRGQNGSKTKTKTGLIISFYFHFRPGRLHFVKKIQNCCTLMLRVYSQYSHSP